MKPIEKSKVNTEFRDGVSAVRPILGRKYTVTHSDETAELFVTIGKTFAEDKIGPLRDEVLLEFRPTDDGFELFGTVLVDQPGMDMDSKMRSEIFLREMPKALQAVRYADRRLFGNWPLLDETPIAIWFKSGLKAYNKLYDFGMVEKYII